MAYCTECGAEIDDSVNYCPECGASTEESTSGAEAASTGTDDSSTSTDSTSSVTLTSVIAWLGGIFILLWALGAVFISPLAGFLGFLTGLFCFPPVRRKLTQGSGVKLSSGVVAIIVIVAFFVSVGAMSASLDSADTEDPATDPDTGGQSNPSTQSEDQSTDSSSGDGASDDGGSGDSFEQYNHDVGESFIVGSGDNQIRYTVQEAYSVDAIGGEYFNDEADGVFVVVELRMENTGSETYEITDRHLKLVDDQDRVFSADSSASYYVSSDDRISPEGITYDQLQPGLDVERAVVFDVPQGRYTMMIEPTGWFSNDEPHFAGMGEIEYRGRS